MRGYELESAASLLTNGDTAPELRNNYRKSDSESEDSGRNTTLRDSALRILALRNPTVTRSHEAHVFVNEAGQNNRDRDLEKARTSSTGFRRDRGVSGRGDRTFTGTDGICSTWRQQ